MILLSYKFLINFYIKIFIFIIIYYKRKSIMKFVFLFNTSLLPIIFFILKSLYNLIKSSINLIFFSPISLTISFIVCLSALFLEICFKYLPLNNFKVLIKKVQIIQRKFIFIIFLAFRFFFIFIFQIFG